MPLIEDGEGRFRLRGRLTFATASELAERFERLVKEARTRLEIDLDGVYAADSAGLVVLLELAEQADAKGVELKLRNLPGELRDLAAISNVSKLLPLD